jgi:hypothetical protein
LNTSLRVGAEKVATIDGGADIGGGVTNVSALCGDNGAEWSNIACSSAPSRGADQARNQQGCTECAQTLHKSLPGGPEKAYCASLFSVNR